MNNLELLLLRLLLYNNNYIRYNNLIDYNYIKNYSNELYYIYKALEEIYKLTDKVELNDLIVFFYTKYPNSGEQYKILFDTLAELELSDVVVENVLEELARKKAALQLSEKAFAFTQGRATLDDLRPLTEAVYNGVKVDEPENVFSGLDIEDIVNKQVLTPGLQFRLKCLRKSLGSLRKGDFGALFARPETGKTTFLASEASYMLDQIPEGQCLLWMNNEEQGDKVILRICQAYYGIKTEQLLANLRKYRNEFLDRFHDKIKFVDRAQIDRGFVEDIIAKINPALALFDQLDKLKGFKAERDDLMYGSIYQWGRELAKQYCPVISVCQAEGSAEGQKWLYMNHMALAKTSKQAECDWILGIGKTHNPNEESVRFLNLSKNKLIGDADSDPELRHGRFEVMISPQIARYEDILSYE